MDLSLHLVSDLDGTWIPAEGELATLRALEAYLTGLQGLTLTFATGRTLHSALTDLSGLVKLWPNHFVTDVGTAIYHRTASGRWLEDAEYARKVESSWDRDAAERIYDSLPKGVRRQQGFRARRRLALEVLPGVHLQGAAEELARGLTKDGFSADVLPSNGRCLDVLPRGVNKGTAIEYLGKWMQPPSLLIACGDSENDLGMLRLADLAVVMADSPLNEDSLSIARSRVIRPKSRGPAGILEVLSSLRSREASDEAHGLGSAFSNPRSLDDTGMAP